MAVFNAQKVVSSLTGSLDADTIYCVRVGTGFDLYVSDSTGATAHKINSPSVDYADLTGKPTLFDGAYSSLSGKPTLGTAAATASTAYATAAQGTNGAKAYGWGNHAIAGYLTDIANNAVSNAKLADMATARIKGRVTAGSGDPEDLTVAQVSAFLGLGSAATRDASEFATEAQGAKADARYPIGHPFAVWDHITGCDIPSNAGTAKFIKLTAGLTGSGQYNNGLLSGESVSGTAPAITATATIVGGPMNGQTVPLINTEQTFIRPGTTSGVLQNHQLQDHQHTTAFATSGGGVLNGVVAAGAIADDASIISRGVSTGSYGTETRPRNRSATFYMRII